MNGGSVGAVAGARVAYDIHNPSNNQENQGPHKVNLNGTRPSSTSNPRTPLSNLAAGRTESSSEYGQTIQQPSHDRTDGVARTRSKTKNVLEVESHHTLYKRNTSTGNLSRAESDDIPENMYRPDRDDVEGWIHREKLAKIENEELQAAGINLAKARTRNRDVLGDRAHTTSRDRLRNDFIAAEANPTGEKRRNVSSPTPALPTGDDDDDAVERSNWDFRTPEEIVAEQVASQAYTTPVLRKSGSKIPVLAPTTTPTQPENLERETSILRKRAMSDSISNEDEIHSSKLRSSSSKWNDEPQETHPVASSKTNSPTKPRQKSISGAPGISSASKAAVPRKTSAAKSNTTSPANRPRTRGNDTERPRTAVNPPEGDPPWLADMYKPDPRLPPDQQLIPTLAKKQRQMQWEESGMIPKTYDREFTPLAVHDNNNQQPSFQPNEPETAIDKPEDSESWPLKPMPGARGTKESPTKPNTSITSTTTGGYSTMPKVSSPPMSMTSPKIGSSVNTNTGGPSPNIGPTRQTSSNQQQKQTTQPRPKPPTDDDDEKAQKKGCACCVVM